MMRTHTTSTKPVSAKKIQPGWKLFDAKDKVLGKIASEAATYLQGKHKVNYVAHLMTGDHVIIINASHVVLTGRKEEQKTYTNYSGYPGGLRKRTASEMRAKRPEEMVRRAISGMLPKNKLRDRMLARLHVYPSDSHPYAHHFPIA